MFTKQDHQRQPRYKSDTRMARIGNYFKRAAVTLGICTFIAGTLYFMIKAALNPQDNFVVIVNQREEDLTGPLSLRLYEKEKTFWTVSYDTAVRSGQAKAYPIPHAILHGSLAIESSDIQHTCKIGPHGRHRNTIFLTIHEHHSTCTINKMPDCPPETNE